MENPGNAPGEVIFLSSAIPIADPDLSIFHGCLGYFRLLPMNSRSASSVIESPGTSRAGAVRLPWLRTKNTNTGKYRREKS